MKKIIFLSCILLMSMGCNSQKPADTVQAPVVQPPIAQTQNESQAVTSSDSQKSILSTISRDEIITDIKSIPGYDFSQAIDATFVAVIGGDKTIKGKKISAKRIINSPDQNFFMSAILITQLMDLGALIGLIGTLKLSVL
jgi:hypothetical protein